ncbi:MAG: hypothetical protein AAFY99_04325 [Pseudomonadota bacterium]
MVPRPFENYIRSEDPNNDRNLLTILVAAIMGTAVLWFSQFAEFQVYPSDITDNDNLMRLVQAQDLLAGQSWYDPVQYRLGLEGGTVMHWSRLIDAPIAAAMFLGGEDFALIIWPLFLSVVTLAGVLYGAFKFGGREALFPAMIAGFGAMWGLKRFWYGALDHHNVQIALLTWCVVLILPKHASPGTMVISGILCALMMAIGIETLPHVALIGFWVFCALIFNVHSKQNAAAYAFGLAATSLVLVPLLLPPSQWGQASCDSFSIFQVSISLIGSFALMYATAFSRATTRTAVLVAGGAAGFLIVQLFFPACLAHPFADLPPLLREFWLDRVVETKSALEIAGKNPLNLLTYFGLPLVSVAVCIAAIYLGYERGSATLFLMLIIAGTLVATWQVRGVMFVVMVSLIPLAVAVTIAREHTIKRGTAVVTALMMALYIASFAPVWSLPAYAWVPLQGAIGVDQSPAEDYAYVPEELDFCYNRELYAVLADEPSGVVLSSTNNGPMVLVTTPHRAIAGPYHRNIDGIMFQIEVLMSPPEKARELIMQAGVTLIADCVAGADAVDFYNAEPEGFQAQLIDDFRQFDWLQVIPQTADQPLRIFRVIYR